MKEAYLSNSGRMVNRGWAEDENIQPFRVMRKGCIFWTYPVSDYWTILNS